MTKEDRKREAVAFWFAKADAALVSARAELTAGRTDFAVNRAYYAVFYAASAVLLHRGRHFVRHAGVRAAVHGDLVNTGALDARWGGVYDLLFQNRHRADYVEFAEFPAGEVDTLLGKATDFVAEMGRLAETGPRPGS